jgi:hypothetical protein
LNKAKIDLISLDQKPAAPKRYSWFMKPVVKVTSLLLMASLLTGCSSAQAKACKQATADIAEFYKKGQESIDNAYREDNGWLQQDILTAQWVEQWAGGNYAKANLVIINNPQCYSNEELANAQLKYDQLLKVNDQFEARLAAANAAVGIK